MEFSSLSHWPWWPLWHLTLVTTDIDFVDLWAWSCWPPSLVTFDFSDLGEFILTFDLGDLWHLSCWPLSLVTFDLSDLWPRWFLSPPLVTFDLDITFTLDLTDVQPWWYLTLITFSVDLTDLQLWWYLTLVTYDLGNLWPDLFNLPSECWFFCYDTLDYTPINPGVYTIVINTKYCIRILPQHKPVDQTNYFYLWMWYWSCIM